MPQHPNARLIPRGVGDARLPHRVRRRRGRGRSARPHLRQDRRAGGPSAPGRRGPRHGRAQEARPGDPAPLREGETWRARARRRQEGRAHTAWRRLGGALCHADSGAGTDCLHVAVDDRSRVAYAELLADERKETCAAFASRTRDFYPGLGVDSASLGFTRLTNTRPNPTSANAPAKPA